MAGFDSFSTARTEPTRLAALRKSGPGGAVACVLILAGGLCAAAEDKAGKSGGTTANRDDADEDRFSQEKGLFATLTKADRLTL
jgi:hypothetical protein